MRNQFKFDTPILYIVFNRLDLVKRTFPEIKRMKPRQLFIGADGPRTKEEKKKTDAVRNYILDNINWKCQVKTLFRTKNLGCKYAVSGAIDWFFENVEQGIILEDDCLPDQSFFRFCQEMLERYKNEKKILNITGQNPLCKHNFFKSYSFSKYPRIWGWATWKRSWSLYDLEMRDYIKNKNILKKFNLNFVERILIKKRIEGIFKRKANTWDIQLVFSSLLNRGLNVIPSKNLVENLGFEGESTHSFEKIDKKFLYKKREFLSFPLKHSLEIKINKKFDKKVTQNDLKRIFFKKIIAFFN